MWSKISLQLATILAILSMVTAGIVPIIGVNPIIRNALIGRQILGAKLLGQQLIGQQILQQNLLASKLAASQLATAHTGVGLLNQGGLTDLSLQTRHNVATVPGGVTLTNTNPTQDLGVYTTGNTAGGIINHGAMTQTSITGTDVGDVIDPMTGQKIGDILETANGFVPIDINTQMILGELQDNGSEGIFVENNGQTIGQVFFDNPNVINNSPALPYV